MHYLISTLLVLFLFMFSNFICLLIGIHLYFLIDYLNRKFFKILSLTRLRLKIALISLSIIISSYQTFRAFYPAESFYIDEFENYSGYKFPESGSITKKEASYPDFQGNYSSSATIKTNLTDYNAIIKAISNENNFRELPKRKASDNKLTEINYEKTFEKIKDKEDMTFTLNFNEIEQTITYQYISW